MVLVLHPVRDAIHYGSEFQVQAYSCFVGNIYAERIEFLVVLGVVEDEGQVLLLWVQFLQFVYEVIDCFHGAIL